MAFLSPLNRFAMWHALSAMLGLAAIAPVMPAPTAAGSRRNRTSIHGKEAGRRHASQGGRRYFRAHNTVVVKHSGGRDHPRGRPNQLQRLCAAA